MTSPLRIAVIGFGAFGQRHATTLRASSDAMLVAVADPTPQAAAAALAAGVPYFADYGAMLDAVKPDAVIVATPNNQHVSASLAAVARGIPVLVEKPIAESLDAARALVTASTQHGTPVLVGHHRRYNPLIERARAAVRDGELGRIVAANALFLIRKPDDYFDIAWRTQLGGGPVLINVIHDIDNLRYIVGEIDTVQATTANAVHGFAVEDSAAIVLRFVGGALGTVLVSDATPAPWSWEITSGEAAMYPQRPDNCYLFAGTEASLALPTLKFWHYGGTPGWAEPLAVQQLHVEGADPQLRQLEHFIRVARGEVAPRIDAADALRTLAATLAVAEAAHRGTTVSVPTT